jgi:hypothetical protein
VAAGDLVHAGPVVRVVGQVVDPAQDGHGPGGVGQQHPDTDASGLDLSGADLVKGFLDNAVQGLAGEPAKSIATCSAVNACSTYGHKPVESTMDAGDDPAPGPSASKLSPGLPRPS